MLACSFLRQRIEYEEFLPALSRFVHLDLEAYYFAVLLGEFMPHKPHHETTIERIFREVTGRRMPPSVRRILLRKPKRNRP
jgi:hypothetical protein